MILDVLSIIKVFSISTNETFVTSLMLGLDTNDRLIPLKHWILVASSRIAVIMNETVASE
jgi:hypothetical protein